MGLLLVIKYSSRLKYNVNRLVRVFDQMNIVNKVDELHSIKASHETANIYLLLVNNQSYLINKI